jgi:hypothetical protein
VVPIHHDGLGMQQGESLVIGVGAHARCLCEKFRHLGHGVLRRQRQVRDQDVHRLSALVLEYLFECGLRRLLASGGGRIERVEAAFEFGEKAVVDVEKERHQVDGFGGALGGIGHLGEHLGPVDQVRDAVVVVERDGLSDCGVQGRMGDEPALDVVAVDGDGADLVVRVGDIFRFLGFVQEAGAEERRVGVDGAEYLGDEVGIPIDLPGAVGVR